MNELQQVAVGELRLHGIKPTVEHTGTGHIAIRWRACPEKEERTVIVAKTPGDWRSRMNARSEVRKYLRADNVALVMTGKPRKKEKALAETALSLPPPDVIPTADQFAALRGEVADLTQLVVKLIKIAYATRDMAAKVLPKEAPAPVKLPSASIKIAEFLSLTNYTSITALVRDTGLTLKQVKLKLEYLRKRNEVSIHQGSAKLLKVSTRRKGRKPRALRVVKKGASMNGVGHHGA